MKCCDCTCAATGSSANSSGVGQVADDLHRARILGGERRPVEFERIALAQRQLRLGETVAQPCGQIAVDLHATDAAGAPDQRRSQRTQPGADLDDALSRPRVDRLDDPLDVMRVMQEVLREALARPMPLRPHAFHVSAS
jgi:hypothetical protein